jgi:hypothetical protein
MEQAPSKIPDGQNSEYNLHIFIILVNENMPFIIVN